MDNLNKDGDSDSREFHGLKISDLIKALTEWKSPPCATTRTDPRLTSTTSILKKTVTGNSYIRGGFRSRAVLPENIRQLSKCHFKRRDYLSESLSASLHDPASITAVASPQEEQLQHSLTPSNPVVSAHVEKSRMFPSESILRVGEQITKPELVQAWNKQQSCEAQWMLPQQVLRPGPTNKWFFEDLTDLQRKLFLGASKKSGVPGTSKTEEKTTRHHSSSLPS